MKLILSLSLFLLSLNTFADIAKPLAASDDLAKVAKAVNSKLRDNNISSGGSNEIWAGKLKSTNLDMRALTVEGLKQAYKDKNGEALPKNVVIRFKVGQFKDGDGKTDSVAKMVKGLLESNAYNPEDKETVENQARYIFAVLRKLPVNTTTIIGEAETRVLDSNGEKATVRYFLVIGENSRTVQLLTQQGSM